MQIEPDRIVFLFNAIVSLNDKALISKAMASLESKSLDEIVVLSNKAADGRTYIFNYLNSMPSNFNLFTNVIGKLPKETAAAVARSLSLMVNGVEEDAEDAEDLDGESYNDVGEDDDGHGGSDIDLYDPDSDSYYEQASC